MVSSVVFLLQLLTGVRDVKEHWKSGPKDIVTMSDASKFEHLLPPKLQELAAACGQPSRTPFPRQVLIVVINGCINPLA